MNLKLNKRAHKFFIPMMLLLGAACSTPELQAEMNLSNVLTRIGHTLASVTQRSVRSLQQFFYSVTCQGVGPFQQTDLIPDEQNSLIIPAVSPVEYAVEIPASAVYGGVEYPGVVQAPIDFSTKAAIIPDCITQVQAPEVAQEITETVAAPLDNAVQEIIDVIDPGTEITETVTAISLVGSLDSDISAEMEQVSSKGLKFLPLTKRIGAFLARFSFDAAAEAKRTFLEHPILTTTAIVASIGCVAGIYGWIKTKSQKARLEEALQIEKTQLLAERDESARSLAVSQQELSNCQLALDQQNFQLIGLQARNSDLDQKLNELLSNHFKQIGEQEQMILNYKSRIDELQKRIGELEVLTKKHDLERKELQAKFYSLQLDKWRMEGEFEKVHNDLDLARQELKKSRTEIKQLEENKAQMEADLADRLGRWTNQMTLLQKQIDVRTKERKNIEQVNKAHEVELHQSDSKQQDDEVPQTEFEGVGCESTVELNALRSRVSSKRNLARTPSKKKDKKSIQDLANIYKESLKVYHGVMYAAGSSQAEKNKARDHMEECKAAWEKARPLAVRQAE